MLREELRRRLADMANAEPGQKARQRRLLAALELTFQVLRRFLSHALEGGKLLDAERVEIRDVFDDAALDKLVDELFPEPLDVHRAARAEELEALLELSGAGEADAAVGRLAFFAVDLRAADRAALGHDEFALGAAALVFQNFDDVRDHVAGALDDGEIADADVLALGLVHVVERGAFDRDAADADGLEARDRRQRAGASDLGLDIEYARRRLARLEFVGDRPARRAGDLAETPLQLQVVHLYDDAVDLVRQLLALLFHARVQREDLLDAVADAEHRHGLEPPRAERFEELRVGRKRQI